MSGETILVVDDDTNIRKVVAAVLEEGGYDVLEAEDGAQGLLKYVECQPDLVVLDILMPNMDGREVRRQIREISTVPIIMLTALSTETDKVGQLNQGADDYLTKPFAINELLARVNALLRRVRSTRAEPPGYDDGHLKINFVDRQVFVKGKLIHLSIREWNVLAFLAKRKNHVQRTSVILRELWGDGYDNGGQILKVVIHSLRKKIGDNGRKPRYILTEHGIGYMFKSHE